MFEVISDIAYEWIDEQAELANHFIVTELTDEGKIAPLTLE